MTGLPIGGKRPAVRLPVANRNKPTVGNDGPLWTSPCIPIAAVSIHEQLHWITCLSARFSRLRISGRLNRSPTPPTCHSTKLRRSLCLARYSSQSKRELSRRFDAHKCCPDETLSLAECLACRTGWIVSRTSTKYGAG